MSEGVNNTQAPNCLKKLTFTSQEVGIKEVVFASVAEAQR